MYTFKAQDKSNAKRFLVKTCKLENFADYLTQHEGKWGTWIDAEGKPVLSTTAVPAYNAEHPGTVQTDGAEAANGVEAEEPAPSAEATAFGNFAASQLAADKPEAAPAPAAGKGRQGATSTTGLKIEKDRPTQNGVTRMSTGTVGQKLFALFDQVGPECTLVQAKAVAVAAGLSATSAAIGLYQWRKFNGYASPGKAKKG